MALSLLPGLYVHVPFCVKKCKYCDFLSFGESDCRRDYGSDVVERYFDALYAQLDDVLNGDPARCGAFLPAGIELPERYDTVYIGGGTPGLADPSLVARLLDKIRTTFAIDSSAEITLEVNPCTVSTEKLRAYRDAGFNRLSIGVQSVSDRLLGILGRVHSAETALRAVDAAVRYFDNINLDFIFGIPGVAGTASSEPQTIEEVNDCLRLVASKEIAHVSFYGLIIEPDTELYRMNERGELVFPDDDKERQMYREIRRYLAENGLVQYEISNFAKPGSESRHNLKYWSGAPYTGLGLGAVSYLPVSGNSGEYVRFRQTTGLADSLSMGTDPMFKKSKFKIQERLDVEARKREFMLLGFRKLAGPDPEAYRRLFGGDRFEADFKPELTSLMDKGLITSEHRLTERGLDFANEIFMEFV